MATKKNPDLSGLVATKGSAAPTANMPTRSMPSSNKPTGDAAEEVPLNFRVSADFRRRVKIYSATNGISQKDLVLAALNEYMQRNS